MSEKLDYMNKINKRDAIFLGLLVMAVVLSISFKCAYADVIKLKSEGRIEGIIQQESEEKVVVEIKTGEITLNKNDIELIQKADKNGNDSLRQTWEKEKQIAQKEIKPQVNIPKALPAVQPIPQSQPVKTEAKKASQISPQAPKRRPGAITIVRCDDGVHSYAACLPSNYEEAGECPVLFCFDPSGDGTEAVRKFAFAAEKYGWIIVGSLNAKNGPWEPILSAQKAMLKDVKKKYNTDESKYYAAGFSGGARMSYTMAYGNPSKFKGVIACGAGFGQGNISKKVAVYHCVGQADSAAMDEMKKAHVELQRKGVKTELNIFQGGHDWPPDLVLQTAVEWIK